MVPSEPRHSFYHSFKCKLFLFSRQGYVFFCSNKCRGGTFHLFNRKSKRTKQKQSRHSMSRCSFSVLFVQLTAWEGHDPSNCHTTEKSTCKPTESEWRTLCGAIFSLAQHKIFLGHFKQELLRKNKHNIRTTLHSMITYVHAIVCHYCIVLDEPRPGRTFSS